MKKEGEQQDEEEELTPPGTPLPPVLPPKDPAPRVRSRRMSVASSRAKVPVVSDPIPLSMPMTPRLALHVIQTFRYPQIIGFQVRSDHPTSSICRLPTSWHALSLLPRLPLRSAPSNNHRPVSVCVTSHLRFLPPQPNSLDSQGTHHSKASRASTALSNLDLVSPPQTKRHQGKRNLSAIPEDTSSVRTSPNPSARGGVAFPPIPPPPATSTTPPGVSFIPPLPAASSTDSPAQLAEARVRDQKLSEKSR